MSLTVMDYGDIFCNAVKNIVQGEISNLGYDISKECTVADIIDKAYGRYLVTDGSIKFEAIAAEGAYYEIGDRVVITIPQGDYNKQISILTKIYDEWSGPAGFVRPLDTIIRCTSNLAINAGSHSLKANGDISAVEVLKLTEQKLIGFQKIGISAKFKTLINGLNVVDGEYGLGIVLKTKDEDIYMCSFSSYDMLGNPYEFVSYFAQEQAFNIPQNFDNITEVSIQFFQNGKFKDGNGNYIESIVDNLFVDNIELYFGYDSSIEIGEIVEINCENLSYSNLSGETRNIDLRWFHKMSENSLEEITSDKCNAAGSPYKVRWYRYTPGCEEQEGEYGGENWERVENSKALPKGYPMTFTATMRGSRTTEKFKAICLVSTYPLINDPTHEVVMQYPSNILTFENTNKETSGGESAAETVKKDFGLVFMDNSYGNYYVYDQNREIIDINYLNERELVLMYKGAPINEDYNGHKITNIIWDYPSESDKSMITPSNKQRFNYSYIKDVSIENFDPEKYQYYIIDGKDKDGKNIYKVATEYKDGIDYYRKISNAFIYSIKQELDYGKTDNTVSCSVEIDGQLFATFTETLQFGIKGSNGTNFTFVLEMLDNKNGIIIGDQKGLSIQALIVNPSGKRVYLEDNSVINWSLINKCDGINKNSTDDNSIINLTYSKSTVPNDNYTILKAAIPFEAVGGSSGDFYLEAYLPIPIRSATCHKMSGCTQILYNHQGVPTNNEEAYVAYINGEQNLDWQLIQDSSNPNPPWLEPTPEGGQRLRAHPIYTKKAIADENGVETLDDSIIQDQVCVYCPGNWSQPILIMQTKYDFAMLNSWDGTLLYDDEKGIILATMLGAGRKNSNDNTFSGVLIGDIRAGSDLNSAEQMTGVYGFDHGVMSFGLKEDGTAFFGASGKGRIEISGKHGAIHSYGWVPTYKEEINKAGKVTKTWSEWRLPEEIKKGSVFDFDDGQLLLEAGKNNSDTDCYFRFNKDGSGGLAISVANLDFKINDQTFNYWINKSEKGIIEEIRRTAQYYATCETEDSFNDTKDSIVEGNQKKELQDLNFQPGFSSTIMDVIIADDESELENNDNQTGENNEDNIVVVKTVQDIFKTGTTIAVLFKNAETVKETVAWESNSSSTDYDENKTNTKYTVQREGRPLSLVIDSIEKPIYLGTVPVSAQNPFGWGANSTVYFTYDETKNSNQGAWIITDSGSYMKIDKTADMISQEVGTLGGNLNSRITQTAKQIKLEVNQKANHSCSCNTDPAASGFSNIFEINGDEEFRKLQSITSGFTLSITFTKAFKSTGNNYIFKFIGTNISTEEGKIKELTYSLATPISWEAGETLPFVYNGEKFVLTSISNSSITEKAESIVAQVKRTAGYGCRGSVDKNGVLTATLLNTTNANDIKPLELEDIMQPGITLSVYIASAHSSESQLSAIKTLKCVTDKESQNGSLSIYRKGSALNDSTNKLVYSVGDTIYFSYLDGKWLLVDSGAMSQITQTADAIKSEVASGLNYIATCDTAASTAQKEFTVSNSKDDFESAVNKNQRVALGIKFSNGISSTSSYLSGVTLNGYPAKFYRYNATSKTRTLIQGLPLCPANMMLSFFYEGGAWILNDNGSYSTLEQTANSIRAEVSGKLDEEGEFGSCGWSITTNGFKIYKEVNNSQINLFTVDTNGNASFAGNLTAAETSFKKLSVAGVKIKGEQYYSFFDEDTITLAIGESDNGSKNGTGGRLIIGDPEYKKWDDVTLKAQLIREDYTQGKAYGNIGTPTDKWSIMYVAQDGSTRSSKKDIQVYDPNQAYEELSTLPLYTYSYKDAGDASHTRYLGTMIDYMPSEFMRTTSTQDGTMFEPNNIIFWNIAASQVMQQKLEALTSRVELLEQKEVESISGIN